MDILQTVSAKLVPEFGNGLERIMTSKEGESLEFKEAKNTYDFEKLVKYCAP